MLLLGDIFPNFIANTTEGEIDFHSWLGDSWGILFSHPSDFTPVCTTELARVMQLLPEFTKRNVKVIGLSCDTVSSHHEWCRDIKSYAGLQEMLHSLNESSRHVGLRMNLDKTKVMFNEHVLPRPVNVDGITLEAVQKYVYRAGSLRGLVDAHVNASMPFRFSQDEKFPYPIIEDEKRILATKLGMVDKDEVSPAGIALTARAVFVVDPNKKYRLSLLYPATTGRNFNEILRVIDSLQLTDKAKVATPVDWKMGDDCMVLPTVAEADVEKTFPRGVTVVAMPSNKTYLRKTPCPEV